MELAGLVEQDGESIVLPPNMDFGLRIENTVVYPFEVDDLDYILDTKRMKPNLLYICPKMQMAFKLIGGKLQVHTVHPK